MIARCIAAAAVLAAIAPWAVAQEAPYAKPARQHQEMARDEGTWDAECTMWIAEGVDPIKSKGVETNKMMGKLWLISDFESEFGGEKFHGHGTTGYDPVKKKYVGTWIDSMTPFIYELEGDYDVESHTLTMEMKGTDGMTGKPTKFKSVTRYESDDSKSFEMSQAAGDDDKWQKIIEIKYTRRK